MKDIEYIAAYLDRNFSRLESQFDQNNLLVQIAMKTIKEKVGPLPLSVILELSPFSKHPTLRHLAYLEGADLITIFAGKRNIYVLTELGQRYLERFLTTTQGKYIQKEVS